MWSSDKDQIHFIQLNVYEYVISGASFYCLFQNFTILVLTFYQTFILKATPEKGDKGAVENKSWKPLTSGIRLDKYSRASDAKNDTIQDRIDIETSDNVPFFSISKPDAAIKLEPLGKVKYSMHLPVQHFFTKLYY